MRDQDIRGQSLPQIRHNRRHFYRKTELHAANS